MEAMVTIKTVAEWRAILEAMQAGPMPTYAKMGGRIIDSLKGYRPAIDSHVLDRDAEQIGNAIAAIILIATGAPE